MEPCTGHVPDDIGQDCEVTGDRSLLGGGRPAPEAKDRRHESVVRLGTRRLGRILRVIDDRYAESAGVGESTAHERRGRHRGAVIGKPDHTRVGELPQRGQRLARPACADRAPREGAHRRTRGDGSFPDPGQNSWIVERRRRVRHQADRREPAVGGGREAGRDRLRLLVPGFAEVDVKIDEPGRDDDTGVVDAVRLVRIQPGHRFEHPVSHDDLARALATRSGVDQPGPRDLEICDDRADGRAGGDRQDRTVPASR